MSYELTDGRESRGQFASNGGYGDLIRYVQAHAAAFPGTLALLKAGESTKVAQIRRELTEPTLKPPANVASTLTALYQLLQGMDRVVISDGLTGGDIKAYSEDEARDNTGKWTKGGDTDAAKYQVLKAKVAQINNSLLPYVDNPTAPEVQTKMDEMKSLVKEISTLHVDRGGLSQGLGTPGGAKDLVIVGAGPGGLASAVMGAADGLDTTVIEATPNVGGQAKYSSRIENYPGFPIGVSGHTLASNMFEQATRLGADVKLGTRVVGLTYDEETGLKTLRLDNGETMTARAVVLAGGVEFKKLDFPGSESPDVIYGNGQLLRDNYAGKTVVVLGGSNGAAQAALGAALTAKQVYLISRSPLDKSMSDYQVTAVQNHSKISIISNDSIARAFVDDANRVTGVETANGKKLDASAIGVFVGSAPNTAWLPTSIEKDAGRIKVNADLETSVPGIFAVGDTRVGAIGRVGAAVGDGQMAERSAFTYFNKLKGRKVDAIADTKHAEVLHFIDVMFDLDRQNPYPLAQYVEKTPDIKAYSDDQPRAADGKWSSDGDTPNYAKNLTFPKPATTAAWRQGVQDNMTALVQKYAGQDHYSEKAIDDWMGAYNALRASGAPENQATLAKAAEGKGAYPEAAANAGLVPLQVKAVGDDIERWTADDFKELRQGVQKVIDGAADANPAMVLEYAHTQAALQQRFVSRNQPTDSVMLYRGLNTNRDGFNNQTAALQTLSSAPEWSVAMKTAGAESWTPDKYKAYEYKGSDGVVLGDKIPVAHIWTSQPTNPQSFATQPTEQEYIVSHPNGVMQLSKTHTEISAATSLSQMLQAVNALRAAGWKATVDGTHIVLEEPHPDINWLHTQRKKKVQAKAHKLDGKTVFQGLPISIENKVGSTRSGTKPDGSSWSVVMPFDYGYIRGTVGEDGDHVDCFIGPVADAKFAYVIHQTKQDSDKYDEDKVMLGFKSAEAAKKAYSSAYDDGKGLMSSMTVLPMSTFIAKVMKTKDKTGSKKIHAAVTRKPIKLLRKVDAAQPVTPSNTRVKLPAGSRIVQSGAGATAKVLEKLQERIRRVKE